MSTLAELLQRLESSPRDARLLMKLGELHQKRGRLALAADAFRRVAEVYAEDGFVLKAIALSKQVLKLDPLLIDVNVRLADWHVQVQLPGEADKYLRIAEKGFLAANRPEDAAAVRLRIDSLKKDTDPYRIDPNPKARA